MTSAQIGKRIGLVSVQERKPGCAPQASINPWYVHANPPEITTTLAQANYIRYSLQDEGQIARALQCHPT